ncbi:uroporphyrinogen decarboxylase family protein, partial [Streptomyces sp. NPDC127044]
MSANDRPAAGQPPTATYESAFLKACRREPVPHTPVWFMRQAGRSLPEYLKVREGIPMLESCMRPELVAEITLQPVRRHNVDAAIYFSDIVVPLKAIGIDLDITPGVGPLVENPIRTRADLAQLRDLTPEDVWYVTEAIKLLTAELGETPLIGFAGAPFTLASYLVEGGPSKNHEHTKALMYGDPQLWAALLDRLADITSAFLK